MTSESANIDSPRITSMRVIPVAGYDSMLLNLSGAHAPFFTRNVVLITDDSGRTGAGEVPGGEKIREVLDDAKALVVGERIGNWNRILNTVRQQFANRDAAGHGLQRPFRYWASPQPRPEARSGRT